jgi:hypothetical protein
MSAAFVLYCVVVTIPAADAAVPSVAIAGSAEVVFFGGASNGSCADYDLPDAPARAWRSSDGTVHLAAAWATLYLSSGRSLLSVEHSCAVAFNSTMSGVNSLYADHEWLVAPWILEDNKTVMGYMHQEFHGWQHNNCTLKPKGNTFESHCWMVAMTSTVSTDGGNTFHHTLTTVVLPLAWGAARLRPLMPTDAPTAAPASAPTDHKRGRA